jgi:RNA polymerase sigma-70 factor, ECF subfamily
MPSRGTVDRADSMVTVDWSERLRTAEDFDVVVQQFRPRVFRFALASLRDPDAADTIAQDCLLKAYQARASFRGECSLNTWIMQIAVNLVRDYARNRRLQFWRHLRHRAQPLDFIHDRCAGPGRTPESQVLIDEEVRAVWTAAAALPGRQRTVFLLRFVEDMDILDIAAAMGLKEGTVKVHLFRALEAIRKRMGTR